MPEINVTIVPVGKIDPAEVEADAVRIAKILGRSIELRKPAAVPRTSEDVARGQHRAAGFLAELRAGLPRLAVDKVVGADAGAPAASAAASGAAAAAAARPGISVPRPNPSGVLFITDVDLFTPNAEGVFGELDARNKAAVLSIRRLREAHYRRKPDPAKQRARTVKLMLHSIGRLHGLADCRDPRCVMAPTGALADIDLKNEKFCAACSRHLTTGAFRI